MPGPEDTQETEEVAGEEVEEPTGEAESEPAPETPEPSPQKPANEMKVVIVIKDENIMLGVQSPNCDPVYKTMKGSLSAALKKVSALVAEAKQQWESTPRYPKADLPEPPPSPIPARTSTASKPAKQTAQPSFF